MSIAPTPPVTPGVFVQSLPASSPAITGASTATTVLIGVAPKGPVNEAIQVADLPAFIDEFGALVTTMELGYAVQQFFANGGATAWVVRVAPAAADADFIAALGALSGVQDFNLLVLPGVTATTVLAAGVAACEERQAFLIIDSPPAATTPALLLPIVQAPTWPRSSNAAVYYPWLCIPDPARNGQPRLTAPGATLAGIFARCDALNGVWHTPAGISLALAGVTDLGYQLNDEENGELNSRAVNCLRSFPVYGLVPWGARTLAGDEARASAWTYLSVRRLALYIEQSLTVGLRWAVFEPNGPALWASLSQTVTSFMAGLYANGAFMGSTAAQAFFVQCDATTTTQTDLDRGVVNVVIGFAPVQPGEFIVLRIQQMASAPA
jgi:uncharacterized protein